MRGHRAAGAGRVPPDDNALVFPRLVTSRKTIRNSCAVFRTPRGVWGVKRRLAPPHAIARPVCGRMARGGEAEPYPCIFGIFMHGF